MPSRYSQFIANLKEMYSENKADMTKTTVNELRNIAK